MKEIEAQKIYFIQGHTKGRIIFTTQGVFLSTDLVRFSSQMSVYPEFLSCRNGKKSQESGQERDQGRGRSTDSFLLLPTNPGSSYVSLQGLGGSVERIQLLMQERRVWEDPLEEDLAFTPVFCLGNPRFRRPGRIQTIASQRDGHN